MRYCDVGAVASVPLHGVATASGTSITYTPAAGYLGTDSFTYTASNTAETSSAAIVSITVTQLTLAVPPGSLPAGQIGTAYSQSLSVAGGTAPYSYASSGAVQTGLNLDSASGMLSGTPHQCRQFHFTITGGLRGQYGFSLKPTELTLRRRFEYSHTFSCDSTARMGYADISDSTFSVSTQGQSENLMTVALGADFSLPGGLKTGVTYQGSYGSGDDSRSHALMLRLGTRF